MKLKGMDFLDGVLIALAEDYHWHKCSYGHSSFHDTVKVVGLEQLTDRAKKMEQMEISGLTQYLLEKKAHEDFLKLSK